MVFDHAEEKVLTVRVHPIEHQHQDRGGEQILVTKHERETSGSLACLGSTATAWRTPSTGTRALGGEHRHERRRQYDGGEEQQPIRSDERDEGLRHARAGGGAGGRTDGNRREQALAALVAVEVVRERPELRDDEDVENAD